MEDNLKLYEKPLFINVLLFGTNVSLFIFKIFFGLLTQSIALFADAFDSITDVIMVVTALIGITFVLKKPNDRFPYGYYRLENIISMVIAMFIFFSAYSIITESIESIQGFLMGNPRTIVVFPEIFIFLFISLFISLGLMFYLRHVGKKSNSSIVQSEASEKIFDVITSAIVLFNFICAIFRIYIVDAILGLVISALIIKGGLDIFLSSTRTLIDAVIDYENRVELENHVRSHPLIKEIMSIKPRGYGKYVVLEMEFSLRKDLPLSKIEQFKRKLEMDIKKKFSNIFKVIMLIHAKEKKMLKIAVPVKNNLGIKSEIFEHFGDSPFFAFLSFENDTLKEIEILENPFIKQEKQKGISISEWLISKKIDKLFVKKELKKAPKLLLDSNFVEIEIDDFKILEDVVSKEAAA
ncbi:MAG: cation diffusion facilitator family transporter [Candidatus Helarchaeales archaeon]